jgi:hypothetical protein
MCALVCVEVCVYCLSSHFIFGFARVHACVRVCVYFAHDAKIEITLFGVVCAELSAREHEGAVLCLLACAFVCVGVCVCVCMHVYVYVCV